MSRQIWNSQKGFSQIVGLLSVGLLMLTVVGTAYLLSQGPQYTGQASNVEDLSNLTGTLRYSVLPNSSSGAPVYWLETPNQSSEIIIQNPSNLNIKSFEGSKVSIRGVRTKNNIIIISITPAATP